VGDPVRIAIISLFKEGYGGGEGRVAHEMARQFARQHEVALICPGERTEVHQEKEGLQVFQIKSVGEGNICVPVLTTKQVSALFDFLDRFSPDVVHAHEPVSIALIGQVWAKMHVVPFVHTMHVLPSKVLSFGAADVLKFLKGPLTNSVIKRFLADFLEHCDAVIALNGAAADDLIRFGYRGRVFRIPNGRDLPRYGECLNADVRRSPKVLTFVGFITRRKNQRYLVEVAGHLGRGYILQLVGESIEPPYRQELDDRIRQLGLDNVHFTGQVDQAHIPSYLEGTHVFVSASTMEVQSLSVIEALASGTPVVGLANETVSELVDDQVGACLSHDVSPQVFAQQVRRICELDVPDYVAMCQAARGRVGHLDWSNVMRLTVEAYQALLRDRPVFRRHSAGLSRLIRLVSSDEVTQFIETKIALLPRHRSRSAARPTLALLSRESRRIPQRTWFLVGVTVVVSAIGGWVVRPHRIRSWFKKRKAELIGWGQKAISSWNGSGR
jgi:1,2-diacylglycerol 3-alpha-glucosyltransferase